MLQESNATRSAGSASAFPASADHAIRPRDELQWLRRALDSVDYAMLCVGPDRSVCAANRAAYDELADPSHPLQLVGSALRPRLTADIARLHRAMHEAQTLGLRRLIMLGAAPSPLSVAVLPLTGEEAAQAVPDATGSRSGALLVFGKRRLCESLSTDWFARERGLTWAETRVLQGLTSGLRPLQIAQRQGVALSTVRSQLRSLRAKTGAPSIGELLRQVSSLPPMLNTLRCASPALPS